MTSDKKTAQDIAIRKKLDEIRKELNLDGVILLEFARRNEGQCIGYMRVGTVPNMDEVLQAIGNIIAYTAYSCGTRDAEMDLTEPSREGPLDH